MEKRFFRSGVSRLSYLFIIPALLSVAVNSTNCAAKAIDSPGCDKNRAIRFSDAAGGARSEHDARSERDVRSEHNARAEDDARSEPGGRAERVERSSRSEVRNGVAIALAPVDMDGIIVSNPTPQQGEPIKVTIAETVDSSVDSIKFNGETYKVFSDKVDGKNVKAAIIAIPALMKPGKHQITAGGIVATITVKDANFGIQRLTLPKKKDNFIASPGEKETIAKAKKTVSDVKRWDGVFKHPAKGRMSTKFGVRRIVNGKLLSDYFHSGQDFAAPVGTPIHAAAPGHVLVAHTGWKLHGNVVVIDHGWGVVSISIHMTKVLVKEGDEVEAGQVVGTIGATGRASGPHLHYCVYVNEVASNPEFWFRNAY